MYQGLFNTLFFKHEVVYWVFEQDCLFPKKDNLKIKLRHVRT